MRTLRLVALMGLVASPVAALISDRAKAEVIVGCKDTKLYHKANCKWVKEIDKAGTRVDFPSVAEAKKAGMKPCEDCKPGM